MKVSIIVPVYNVEKYIERCFNSIVNQTYYDIECIFVDDSTPDNSGQILRELISKYEGVIKFIIVKHDKNKGLAAARNTGTKLATGDYIYYLDSDDEITLGCIEDLTALALKYPDVDMVQGITKIDQNPYIYIRVSILKFQEYSNDRLWMKKQFLESQKFPESSTNKLIRTNFLIENSLYFKEGVIFEDVHWMFFVVKKINTAAFCKKVTYIRYILPDTITTSSSNYKCCNSALQIIRDMIENVDNELPRKQRFFIAMLINLYMRKIKSGTEEFVLIRQYRFFVKKLLRESLKKVKIYEILIFTMLLIPNFPGIKVFTRIIICGLRGIRRMQFRRMQNI